MKLIDVVRVTILLIVASAIGGSIYAIVRHERAKAAARPMVIEFNGKRYQELGRSAQISIDGLRYIEIWEAKK